MSDSRAPGDVQSHPSNLPLEHPARRIAGLRAALEDAVGIAKDALRALPPDNPAARRGWPAIVACEEVAERERRFP